MSHINLSLRSLMSLLFNGDKAIDVVRTSLEIGLLDAIDPGPVSLGELSARFDLVPMRLYKLLDCLECVGFVQRRQSTDTLLDTEYRAVSGAKQAAVDVVGPASLECDRDTYPWRTLHGRLTDVLRGSLSVPDEAFGWPLRDEAQIASFEKSMAAGLGPIVETFRSHADQWLTHSGDLRLLDVGGGDGTLAAHLLRDRPGLLVDVYNLPGVELLVDRTRTDWSCGQRLGFVAGDFLTEPLPSGYDVMSFVRVLHDWSAETARALLEKAYAALESGGRVVVCEEFRTAERLARQFFWSYFLIGVDSCSSLLREEAHYVLVLTETGFRDVEVLPGPFELIVATKP